jgi:hypothetical protein
LEAVDFLVQNKSQRSCWVILKKGFVLHLQAGWGASLGLVDIHSYQLPTTSSIFMKHLQDKEGDESESFNMEHQKLFLYVSSFLYFLCYQEFVFLWIYIWNMNHFNYVHFNTENLSESS